MFTLEIHRRFSIDGMRHSFSDEHGCNFKHEQRRENRIGNEVHAKNKADKSIYGDTSGDCND